MNMHVPKASWIAEYLDCGYLGLHRAKLSGYGAQSFALRNPHGAIRPAQSERSDKCLPPGRGHHNSIRLHRECFPSRGDARALFGR